MAGSDPYATYEHFRITQPEQYITVVEINRPTKLNSFIESMWLDLARIFKSLSTDPDVRVVILTASGAKAFSAGLDVQAASTSVMATDGQDVARKANATRRHIAEFQDCISAIERCEKPVIALLHGITYGLGVDMSLACDIRYATATTRFSVKEVDIGLAADIGTLSRLPHSGVPMSWIKEVCLTAREFDAQEALGVGLVSRVLADKTELLRAGTEVARLIASKSPVAVLGTKEILNWSRDHGVDDGLRYTAVWNAAFTQSQDLRDAMLAGLKRTKPVFPKL